MLKLVFIITDEHTKVLGKPFQHTLGWGLPKNSTSLLVLTLPTNIRLGWKGLPWANQETLTEGEVLAWLTSLY
jgi:hypothetical protein